MIVAFLNRLASPPGFYRFADKMIPWVSALCLLLLLVGIYGALLVAPPDYQQGEAYRIMYIHVPSAWMSLFIYVSMATIAGIGLIWKFKLAGVYVRCAAPVGAVFTLLTLITGSVWGKPMWGSWWVWDARLTSELILLFLYLGFIALQSSISDRKIAEKIGAVLLLIGVVNIPIIHYSVEWWSTLHQPASILKWGAPSIHISMLKPLLLMAFAFKLFFLWLILLGMQAELLRRGGAWTLHYRNGNH